MYKEELFMVIHDVCEDKGISMKKLKSYLAFGYELG
jgi:hypothetical protein